MVLHHLTFPTSPVPPHFNSTLISFNTEHRRVFLVHLNLNKKSSSVTRSPGRHLSAYLAAEWCTVWTRDGFPLLAPLLSTVIRDSNNEHDRDRGSSMPGTVLSPVRGVSVKPRKFCE